MATARTRKRTIPRLATAGDLTAQVKEYLLNRSMREKSEHQEGSLKRLLMEVLEVAGEQVGNKQVISLEEALPYTEYKGGKPKPRRIAGIERRESSTTSLDEDKTFALLKRKKLLEECTTTLVVIDEDAVLAANYDGKITDKELADLNVESKRYSFWLADEPRQETP